MAEKLGRSFDGDGVLFTRYPFPFQAGAFIEALRNPQGIYLPPEHIPDYERVIYEPPKTFIQTFNEFVHAVRWVFPDVKRIFHELGPDEKSNNFLNTGRAFTEEFIHITKTTLEKGGILPYFQDLYFRPEGLSTAESKIAGILEMIEKRGFKSIEHYDDNPRDAFKIAAYFLKRNMNVNVVIVSDASAGLLFSRRELLAHPNVRRAANLRQGIFGTTKPSATLQQEY